MFDYAYLDIPEQGWTLSLWDVFANLHHNPLVSSVLVHGDPWGIADSRSQSCQEDQDRDQSGPIHGDTRQKTLSIPLHDDDYEVLLLFGIWQGCRQFSCVCLLKSDENLALVYYTHTNSSGEKKTQPWKPNKRKSRSI